MFSWQDLSLVSFGAILGTWLRFYLLKLFQLFFKREFLGTFLVNFLATCTLSFIITSKDIALEFNKSFNIFFLFGFLGSLSTFSTFILETSEAVMNNCWREGLFIIFLSVLATFIAGSIIFLFN